ncbi:RHS repeat-associated core domain-containing protein, partial [Flavobacterium oreochromis]
KRHTQSSGNPSKKRINYYPFGSLVPNRHGYSKDYRYGFQGQEKDDQIKGEGNSLNYEYRMHDPRVGRFFATDPLTAKYPYYSPYQFSGNRVIDMIELEGLEATATKLHNVYFVKLENANVDVVIRKSNQTISEALKINDKPNKDDYSFNLNLYKLKDDSFSSKYNYRTSTEPQPMKNFTAEGLVIEDGKRIAGASSDKTFYFAKVSGVWTSGEGNPPSNSSIALGGGIPVYVNGTKYGVGNIAKSNAPSAIPSRGNPNNVPLKYFKQRNNDGYEDLNDPNVGKTVLAYNSKDKSWMVVSQQDDTDGMTLDAIRDNLISKGYDSIVAFDGSTSSTLIHNKSTLVEPAEYKDNAVPVGVTISAPNKKNKK